MLLIKAFHIIFMVTWFAGLFYLPRLFVYHAMSENAESHKVFLVMEKKLLAIMTIGAVITCLLGIWLIYLAPGFLKTGWLHSKLFLVILLCIYHFSCFRLYRLFVNGKNRYSHVWYRWFNEIPAILLISIVILVELQPF